MNLNSKRLLTSIKKLVVPSVGLLVFTIFTSMILFEATKVTVDVTQDGQTETMSTHAETVGDLVKDLGVVVGEADDLSHGLDETLENGMSIDYKQAKDIVVKIDGLSSNYATTAETVGEFLREKDLSFSDRDDVSFDTSDPIEEDLTLSVTKAYPVVINDGGEKIKVWTTGDSIESLLDENDIELSNKDKVKPALNKRADENTSITVTRVEKETDTVEETVAYETEKRNDDSLPKGEEKVISDGKEGKLVKEYEITLENGKEVDRKLVTEEVREDSQNQVIAVGTKEPEENLVTLADKKSKTTNENTSNDTNKRSEKASTAKAEPKEETSEQSEKKTENNESNNTSDGEVMYMNATAYSADCSGCSGITATGIDLKSNPNKKVVAVDPNVIPLGSTVWVEGYGTAVAGDTGGAINGKTIDLHVPSHAEADAFGRQTVKVKVIK